MHRDFDITVRHESGVLRTKVTLLPDSPNKRAISAVDDLPDTQREAAFEVDNVTTFSEFMGKTIAVLIDDMLDMDKEGKANIKPS